MVSKTIEADDGGIITIGKTENMKKIYVDVRGIHSAKGYGGRAWPSPEQLRTLCQAGLQMADEIEEQFGEE